MAEALSEVPEGAFLPAEEGDPVLYQKLRLVDAIKRASDRAQQIKIAQIYWRLAIAQAEVTDLMQLSEHLEPLTKALNDLRDKRGLDFAMLLITDVVRGSSRLILSSDTPMILADLPYPPLPDGTRDAPGVVSRKKQLLPVVLGLLEK